MKNVHSLSTLQKKILNLAELRKSMLKMRDWMQAFEGDNEEGLRKFFSSQIVSVMSREENSHLSESNALMIQYALTKAKNKAGE